VRRLAGVVPPPFVSGQNDDEDRDEHGLLDLVLEQLPPLLLDRLPGIAKWSVL
jgi:hypothetical protein